MFLKVTTFDELEEYINIDHIAVIMRCTRLDMEGKFMYPEKVDIRNYTMIDNIMVHETVENIINGIRLTRLILWDGDNTGGR